jgi:hypothetical protein
MEIYTFRLPHSGRQSRNRAARMNVFFGGHQTWNRTLESLSLHFPLSFLPLPHSGRQSRNCAARMSASEKSLHFPHSGRLSRNCARGRISFVGGVVLFFHFTSTLLTLLEWPSDMESHSKRALLFPHSGRQSRNRARGRIPFVEGSYCLYFPLHFLFLSDQQTWNRTLKGLYTFLPAAVSHGIALEGVSPS